MAITSNRAACLALAGAALMLGNTHAFSQKAPDHSNEVRIEASRPVVKQIGRSLTTGAPIDIVQLTRHVSYADLDLATHAGASELEARIKSTAREACRQLEQLYPIGTSEGPGTEGLNCVKDAIDGAMPQAKTAIAAAEKRASSAPSASG